MLVKHPSLLRFTWLAPVLAVIVSCATVSGGTLSKVTAAEKGDGVPKKTASSGNPSVSKPSSSKGLQIVSDPDGADVFLNGNPVGRTPLVIEKLDQGRYHLEIRKDGYEIVVAWIEYPGDAMLFQTSLVRITGYLRLSISPAGSIAFIEGERTDQGIIELPIGSYTILARAFGYGDQRLQFVILPRSTTSVDISLEPVDFAVARLSALRTTLNPDDPGMLGIMEISFSVTGPGTGKLSVTDASSNEVYRKDFPPFTTWDYAYTWDCRSSEGQSLPDGEYRIVVSGTGPDTEAEAAKELEIRLDRTGRKTMRTVWSGSSGLMYAPSAEVLPDGGIHFAALGAAAFLGTPLFRAPFQLSMRMGLGGRMELDFEGGFIAGETLPFTLGVAGRYSLVQASGGQGFAAAAEAKLSGQFNPLYGVLITDTFSNFTGFSAGLPIQLTMGPASFLADASVIATLWNPYDEGVPPAVGFTSWAYLRAGFLLDFGSVMGGLSISARTEPFTSGVLSIAVPFQAAAEVHWLVPGTHVVLSGIGMGEIEDFENFYFLGGLGFGLIY